jgi:hypothetical protein
MKVSKLVTTILCLSALVNSSNVQSQTFECEGKKMTVEGSKIANFVGTDNLTRNVTATIRQDSIIYCVIRTNADGSINKMMKFHLFIGDIALNTRTTERAFATWDEGARTMNKLTFYTVDNKQLNWYEEMICHLKQFGLYRKEVLEMSFDTDAAAREFFAKVQALHMSLPPKTSASNGGADTKSDNKGSTYNTVVVFNDLGKDMYVKKDMDPGVYHIAPNSSHSFTCKVGEKVSWCEKNSTTLKGTLFTISEQMIKDKTIKLSSGTKK